MNTSTRKSNIVKTLPHAFHAVAQHMIDHGLPGPHSIDAPSVCLGEDTIVVRLPSAALTMWLDSVVVDDETTVPSTVLGWSRSSYATRLPTGFRVTIIAVHQAAAPSVVPA